jgi:hypothetical protein
VSVLVVATLRLSPRRPLFMAFTAFAASPDGLAGARAAGLRGTGEGSASDEPHVEPSEPKARERDSKTLSQPLAMMGTMLLSATLARFQSRPCSAPAGPRSAGSTGR